jgi:hypothetical protein
MLESPSKNKFHSNNIQLTSIKTSNSLFDVSESSQQTEQIQNSYNNNITSKNQINKSGVENSGLFYNKENIDILKWNINERSNSNLTLKDLNVINNNNNNDNDNNNNYNNNINNNNQEIDNKGPLNINELNDNINNINNNNNNNKNYNNNNNNNNNNNKIFKFIYNFYNNIIL